VEENSLQTPYVTSLLQLFCNVYLFSARNILCNRSEAEVIYLTLA